MMLLSLWTSPSYIVLTHSDWRIMPKKGLFGSDGGLLPVWCQAITRANAGSLIIEP